MADVSIVRGDGGPFKASGRNTEGRFDFFVLDIDYLTGPPLHVHALQEDTFYVLDGVLTIQVGDDVVELSAGDYGSVPPGVPHTFTNTHADQPVRAVNLMTPGIGFDRFIEHIGALPEGGGDPAAMEQLSEQYGVKMVGPPLAVKLGLA
jgi:mannose-6-phosphate isomerase-like protein (cupin superfamily)